MKPTRPAAAVTTARKLMRAERMEDPPLSDASAFGARCADS
jgi:hypothetical protein